ncbi:MAG: HEAT repeat domain-containing protein [Zavarzinella sp.]
MRATVPLLMIILLLFLADRRSNKLADNNKFRELTKPVLEGSDRSSRIAPPPNQLNIQKPSSSRLDIFNNEAIFKALESGNIDERLEALRLIYHLGGDGISFEAVVKLTRDSNAEVRSWGAALMVFFPANSSIYETLWELINYDCDVKVVNASFSALRQINEHHPARVAHLAPSMFEFTKHESAEIQRNSFAICYKHNLLSENQLTNFLLAILVSTKTVETQEFALDTVSYFGNNAISAIRKSLEIDNNFVKLTAIKTLKQFRRNELVVAGKIDSKYYADLVAILIQVIESDDSVLVDDALIIIERANLFHDTITLHCTKLVQSSSPIISRSALLALTSMGSPAISALPSVINALKHSNVHVRCAALSAITAISPQQAILYLRTALSDQDRRMRYTAVDSIKILIKNYSNNSNITSLALLALKDPDESIRATATSIFTKMKFTQTIVLSLIHCLRTDPSTLVREDAASSLAEASDYCDIVYPAFIQAMNDNGRYVRLRAIQSMGKLKKMPEIAVPALILALDDSDSMVVSGAIRALAEYGQHSVSAVPKLRNLTGISELSSEVAQAIKAIQGD